MEGRYFRRKYDKTKYEIVGFLDNAVSRQEHSEEFECDIYNPVDWKKLPKTPILCMSVHFLEMWRQLVSLGVPEERIILGICIMPYYYDYERILFSQGGYINIKKETLIYVSQDKEIFPFDTNEGFLKIIRNRVRDVYKEISNFRDFRIEPISRTFGGERESSRPSIY